jgi:UDP-N-acetylglucosamine--N-acetylmuramyl-(pentapeptide) pyrophosphoryl-undecaprenol N-acetylglucosamine transferase
MNEQKNISVVIAGGGTGGHIFPAIAIANALKERLPNATYLFVGAKGKMEMEKVPQAGFEIVGIDIAGFNRSSLLKNIGLPFLLLKSFLQVKKIFSKTKPDLVIGVGGYSTFPVLRLAQAKGIPTFIHESNSFAGKSNMLLGSKATKVFVAWQGMEQFFPKEKLVITGNPVRQNIKNASITKVEACRHFGLNANKPVVLSIGGSLGAKSINDALAAGLQLLADKEIQLIWQTGKPFANTAMQIADGKEGVYVSDFIREMDLAYAAADAVISRAGAMAITEIAVVGKAAVLVPYPFAAEDHQTVNAKHYVKNAAALMINDKDASANLIDTIIQLVTNDDERRKLENNVKRLAVHNADAIIANEIIKTISV